MPLVSVVIPMHNDRGTIAEALGSVAAQSLGDWEAIVVDDGSTDDSVDVVVSRGDPRVRVIRQANAGAAAARNRGVAAARGRYVHFLDADDWLLPRGLEALVWASEMSGRGAACGAWSVHGEDGGGLGVRMAAPALDVGLEHLLEGNRIAPHSQIIRRDLLGPEPFDASERFVRDYDLWLRLAGRGVRWAGIDEVVAGYRVRRGSLSKQSRTMARTAIGVLDRHAGASDRSRRGIALFYATTEAVGDGDPEQRAAAEILAEHTDAGGPWSPEELGAAAWWSLLFGHGLGPRALVERSEWWLARALAWWARLGASDRTGAALGALASEAVQPEAIAWRLLAQAPAGTRVIDLVGALGKNGRIVAGLASEAGLGVRARDDRLPGASIEGPYGPGAVVIVAPLASAALEARLPRGIGVLRWADARSELAGALAGAIEAVLAVGRAAGPMASSAGAGFSGDWVRRLRAE